MLTRWGETLDKQQVLQEYPRPQLVRESFYPLNGLWDYAVAPVAEAQMPEPQGEILVPFCIESSLSGVCTRIDSQNALW